MKLFHSSGIEGSGIPEPPQREIPAMPSQELPNNLHRHFDPTPGQWLSEEPIAFAASAHNLRPYAGTPKQDSP